MKKPPEPARDQYKGVSCPEPSCRLFNQPGQGNLRHRSWTGKNKEIERIICQVWGREFSERRGTLMEKTKLPEEKVTRLLKCQCWGVCDEGTADICEVDIKTVHRFQRVAFARAQEHHEQVVQDLTVEGVQMDEMWSKVRGHGRQWVLTALAMKSFFLLWVEMGQRGATEAATLVAQVVARLRRVPLFLTDGWKVYKQALLRVLGHVYRPPRRGVRGRHPKPRLLPPPDLFYAQVVKVRSAAGRIVEVTTRLVFGGPRRFFHQLARRRLGSRLQTAFQQRWYATRRGLCACAPTPHSLSVALDPASHGPGLAAGGPVQHASPPPATAQPSAHPSDGHRLGRSCLELPRLHLASRPPGPTGSRPETTAGRRTSHTGSGGDVTCLLLFSWTTGI